MKVAKNEILSRKKEILQYLRENGACRNEELAGAFGLSISTVRRYVQQMEDDGTILRYHGGIMLGHDETEMLPYTEYSDRNSAEKDAIMAYIARNLIRERDIVFINGSSTAMHLYPHLETKCTVVTNNAKALFTEYAKSGSLILIGGEPSAHNGENILCGEFATSMISSINANTCILGVSGVSGDAGLTSSSPQDISINRAMLSRTRGYKVVAADHSKIGMSFNFSFSTLHGITHLVTDAGADPAELARIRNAGVEVVTVEV